MGSIPRKRHIAHPQQPGFKSEGIYYEEVVTTAGFSRAYSMVYHLRPPTRVTRLGPAGTILSDFGDQPTLRDHLIKTRTMPRAGDPIEGRVVLLGNDDVTLARCRPDQPEQELFRNADADELVFVHSGRGLLQTMFGPLPFRDFDYIVIPRSTTYRLEFEPITGRVHQPPPVHQTFEAPGFVVCTFAPRMLDTDPEAIKVPYAHSNVQADEVLYYVRGRFGSRRGVEEASFTLHPRGIPHGPHPGTIAASKDARSTDELAVMVDTIRPLQLTRRAMQQDDPSYPLSWID